MEHGSRWLLAWMNEEEAVAALLGRTPAPDEDLIEPRRVWRDSRAALLCRTPYQQSTPVLAKLPAQLKKQAAEFRQLPDVIAELNGQDWKIGVVDLRSVLSLQRVVEESALQRAQKVIADTPRSLFSFCLPQRGLDARVSGMLDRVNKAITLTSQNGSFRIRSPLMLDLDVSPGRGSLPEKRSILVSQWASVHRSSTPSSVTGGGFYATDIIAAMVCCGVPSTAYRVSLPKFAISPTSAPRSPVLSPKRPCLEIVLLF